MPTHVPAGFSEQFRQDVNPWLDGQDVVTLLSEMASTSVGYRDVWRKLVERLRSKREALESDLEEEQSLAELDRVIEFTRNKVKEANRHLISLGIIIPSPIDRGFRKAASLVLENNSDSELTDAEVQEFIQTIYDSSDSAAATIRIIINILKRDQDSPETAFLIAQLSKIKSTDVARLFKTRGYTLEDRSVVCARTALTGETVAASESRRARLDKLSALSPLRREQERIRLAELRGFDYAGRRKDIKDMDGHHPFITSIYAANLARQLTRQGRKWLYRPTAFVIKVPATESIPQRNILFEPDFYIPAEDLHIKILTNRRYGVSPPVLGSLEEREEWVEAIRRLRPDLNINTRSSDDLDKDTEVLSVSVRIGEKTTSISGRNISTAPEEFLLPENACPCSSCRLNYGNSGTSTDGNRTLFT